MFVYSMLNWLLTLLDRLVLRRHVAEGRVILSDALFYAHRHMIGRGAFALPLRLERTC